MHLETLKSECGLMSTPSLTNKVAKLAFLAALVLATATNGFTNVLTNPGFETDAVLDAPPTPVVSSWTTGGGGSANTASANGDPTHSGTGSLLLAGFGGFGVPLAYQAFPANPGETWNFQGYMRTTNTLPADATFGLLKIVWVNSLGQEIAPGTAIIGTANNSANPGVESTPFLNSASALNTWIFTRAQGVAPSGTAQVRLFALMVDQSAGAGYFDDLDATNAPPVGPPPIDYPTNNAPNPTNSAASVLSLYNSSGTYTDATIDTWYTPWSNNPGGNSDYTITNTGRIVKKYLTLSFAGVEFISSPINASGYNTLHVDVWTPNANQFGVQLVSLDPTTQAGQVNFFPASGKIVSNTWVGLDIPLSQFTDANGNLDLTNLKQLLWIDNQGGGGFVNGNFYIDNVYFYSNAVAPPVVINYPTNAAPNPTQPSGSVVSLYTSSGVYTPVPVDTWLTPWSSATLSDYTITNASRVVKKYTSLNFAGVEFFNPKIDASAMNTFHVDLWTPNATKFSVKLVSFGAVTAEHEVVFTNNVIVTNTWVSLNIPVSTFTNASPNMDFANLGQLLFINNNPGGAEFGTFYIDNVYFYAGAAPATRPTIVNSAVSGANFTAQVAGSQAGHNYVLQGTTTVSPPTWTNLQTNSGTGGTLNFSVPVTGVPQRFFRISVQ